MSPPLRCERMLKRARAMAHLASSSGPDDSQTAKTPYPPETPTEAAALTRVPRPWCEVPQP